MDLFWQITLVEFLLNVAVFASAIIALAPLRMMAPLLPVPRPRAEGIVLGLLFGLATAGALFLPVHFEGGAAISCQTMLLALAGPLGGLSAVLSATTITIAVQLFSWFGGGLDMTAVASSLISASVGFALHLATSRGRKTAASGFGYVHLPLLGALSGVGGTLALLVSDGPHAAAASIIPALISSISAAGILGTLLLHERRRHQVEVDLRQSEAHLALLAKDLAAARDAAEAASGAKSAFLANMSHELRTPLNAILGYAQMFARNPSLSERELGAALTIQQSGEHLLMLITDILDLAKIEAGKLELHPGPIDLGAFLAGVGRIIRIRAEEKAVSFALDIPTDRRIFIQADEKRLRQILLNLLGNAVKFTDRGEVSLGAKITASSPGEIQIRFEVRDTGVGIARDQLAIIFRPFEQVGKIERQAGGTGLGLSISRQLVELMHSEIHVESTLGEGSRFWFDISVPLAETVAETGAPEGMVTGYAGRRRRVLIVDDVAANRAMLSDVLAGLDFVMAEAANGFDAVRDAEATPPDLILMDIRMPVMDGLEAISRLRQIEATRSIPIVAVSAGATDEDQAASTAAGADGFLIKPVEHDRLLREMARHLSLEWIAASPSHPKASQDDAVYALVPPPREELEALRELAAIGNMRGIERRAAHLTDLDAVYRPFAEKLRQMAQAYQSKAVLNFVEAYADQARIEH
jgi:signal transduction histidine kinase/DNA-binding NarL/FixJ family response regulator